jgi:ABC-type bacteriocin/lantibiotic exporter with double-glycine peptidase domain
MTEHDQTQEDTGKRASLEHPVSKARGYFFAAFENFPYEPHGVVLGQNQPDSCVAACCRMLLHDHGIEISEAFVRHALELEEGAFVSQIPDVLQSLGLNRPYVYRRDLTVVDLAAAVKRGTAVVFVKMSGALDGHALLVEEMANDLVAVRDPLPEGEGKAYRARLADFLRFWIHPKTGRGQAAIVVE